MISEKKKKTYLEITSRFCENAQRDYLKAPFEGGGKIIASDTYKLVALPLFLDGRPDYSSKLERIYPIIETQNQSISIKELKEGLATFPCVDCYDMISTSCKACCATGEVEAEFEFENHTYTMDVDCPICDGETQTQELSDTPNGKKKLNTDYHFQIGECFFNPEFIADLVFVAELLKSDTINLVHQQLNPLGGSAFKIAEAEVILMPILIETGNVGAKVLPIH